MLLYILDDHLSVVGVIDQWQSFIWVKKYREADDFELTVLYNDSRAMKYLKPQHYIARPDTDFIPPLYRIGYISSIQDNNDGEVRTVTVSGYGVEGIFRKRIFPFWTPQEKLQEYNLVDLIKSLNFFGCRMSFNLGLFEPNLLNVPADYMSGDMEKYLRYLMTSGEIQYTYTVYLSYEPDKNDNGEFVDDQVHPRLLFLVEDEIGRIRPEKIVSEGTDNFSNATYSFSEDGTYSKIYVQVDPNFSVTVTEDDGEDDEGNPKTKQTTVTYDDLEIKNMPSYVLDLTDDMSNSQNVHSAYLAANEYLLYVDPVIKKGQKREYGTAHWIKSDVPIGNCVIASDGTQYLVMPSELVDTWGIDQEATLESMKKAAEAMALLGTENYTGTMVPSELETRNKVYLGYIALVRDDVRRIDFYKRVEEIEEVWDNNGYTYKPTFGEPLKTIYDLIERR